MSIVVKEIRGNTCTALGGKGAIALSTLGKNSGANIQAQQKGKQIRKRIQRKQKERIRARLNI